MMASEPLAAALRLLSSCTWLETEMAARQAMADDPDDPHAEMVAGLAVAAMGEVSRAAPILVDAAARRPGADHPCAELARLQPPLPRALVERQFRACLDLAPADSRLRLDFAAFLLETARAAEAERFLADVPDSAARHHLMGLVQAELGRFPAAIDCFEQAAALKPDAGPSWSNLGMMLKIEGRFADAIVAHDRALALEPDNHRYRVNRAVALLKMGAWEPAWRDYESRLSLTGAPAFDADRLMPVLRPNERLDGVTVLAVHEDGFGDTMQFLRYLPLLAERGAKVVACVPSVLERVMRLVPGVADVVIPARRMPPHDYVCPMFSLPRVFGTTVDTIPPVPVLVPEAAWLRQAVGLVPSAGLRVGLVWAGQARPSVPGFATLDRRRSAGLAVFAPLFDVSGVSFVSLQAGAGAHQARLDEFATIAPWLTDPMWIVDDFADTAAIIAHLDVVVSVDTSVVHLAGLLDKPVFLLDRYDGCWRWLSGRTDSPWYQRLTIFRQDRPDDWSGPMARVAAALREMAEAKVGIAA
jgi:tetratricopeptide (TPR) repeat protein